MMKTKSTKRALLLSALALLACISMLVGSTFAWFTDSVTSSSNKIVAGKLDVQLFLDNGDGYEDISNATESIFNMLTNKAQNNNADTLWEPGKTQVAYLKIKNAGTLALKYTVALKVYDVEKDLYEVMEYAITPDATYGTVNAWDADNGKQVVLGTQTVTENDVVMAPGAEHNFALSIHMLEEAGNEYQEGKLNFDLTVLAGQADVEADAFGTDYDKYAEYAYKASAKVEANRAAYELVAKSKDPQQYNVGYVNIPAEAVADDATELELSIVPTEYDGNFTVAANQTAESFEVTVKGLKAGNTTPVKAALKIPTGLDPATVKLYHKDALVADARYNPTTGYVTFETSSFSPFTVVYDADSEYEAPSVEGLTAPKAIVTYAPEYVGEGKVQWGNYGQWSPTEGLDSALEAAFIYKCPELTDEVRAAFENWNCDFYVSLNRDLGANQIFLGGYYDCFGAYVGFHNGDVTLKAGEELPLLGSVTTNPWTYADVEEYVGTFMCGVGDVDDALEGATFTVKLRLTNPADETEFYDVNVVTYTFGGNAVIDGTTVVTSGQGLQDAINNGDTNISLGDDIDLSQGIVIP